MMRIPTWISDIVKKDSQTGFMTIHKGCKVWRPLRCRLQRRRHLLREAKHPTHGLGNRLRLTAVIEIENPVLNEFYRGIHIKYAF